MRAMYCKLSVYLFNVSNVRVLLMENKANFERKSKRVVFLIGDAGSCRRRFKSLMYNVEICKLSALERGKS